MRRVCILLFLTPLPLAAQRPTLTVDVGTARMRFADSISATALSLSPSFQVIAPRGSFAASGTMSQLGGASSHSGVIGASLATERHGLLSGEVEGIAGGSAHGDGTRTGQLLGLARLHIARGGRGAWLGGGGGSTWDGAWRSVVRGDAGAWLAKSTSTFALRLSPTVVDDSIRYADTFLSAYYEMPSWELDASLGVRAGGQLPGLPANRTTWGRIGATFWASARLGLAASAGSYPVDFAQGYPGNQFISLSVRFRTLVPERVPRSAEAASPEQVRGFQARRLSGDLHRIRVFAPSARAVELSGDFTQWTPIALDSEGRGWWATTVSITSGTHEVNVRVNAGSWQVPPGLIPSKDEFGGAVGVLIVPE